jgi:hypothetical protein
MGLPTKLPKGFEYGWLQTVIENSLDQFFTKYPEAFKDFVSRWTGKPREEVNNQYFLIKKENWKDFGKHTSDVFVPTFDIYAQKPFRESKNNFSDWRAKDIVPEAVHNPENRETEYSHYTTDTAKYIGKLIGKVFPESWMSSPTTLEYFTRGVFGTLGQAGLNTMDAIIKGGELPFTDIRVPGARELITGEEEKIDPEREWADVPGLKAFIARLPSISTRNLSDFYENYEKSKKSNAAIKRLARSDEGYADEIRSNSNLVKMEGAAKSLAAQRRYIDEIMNEHHRKRDTWVGKIPMAAEEKRVELFKAFLRMNQIAMDANANYFGLKEENEKVKKALPARSP